MEIIKEEIHIKHNNNIFRRIYDYKTKRLYWQLCQINDEVELWTTLSNGAFEKLNEEYNKLITTRGIK